MLLNPADFRHWLPGWIDWQTSGPEVVWCQTGGELPTCPFYDDDVTRWLRHPFNRLLRRHTPLRDMAVFAEGAPECRPAGFLFHLSRCGSTLLTRMLAALPQTMALSEPPPVEAVLHAHLRHAAVSPEQRLFWLKCLMGAFAAFNPAQIAHLFVKFDCWSLQELALIQQAFPDTPCVFVYRDPVEVLVSHERSPGRHMLAGALPSSLFGLEWNTALGLSPLEYRVRVLAALLESARCHARNGQLHLLHYRELPHAVPGLVRTVFGLDCPETASAALLATAGVHAKYPNTAFEPDTAKKRAEAGEALKALVMHRLQPVYSELEALRAPPPTRRS